VESYSHIETKDAEIYKDKAKFMANIFAETETVEIERLPRFVIDNQERFASLLYSGSINE
jgi:hypothetical protein